MKLLSRIFPRLAPVPSGSARPAILTSDQAPYGRRSHPRMTTVEGPAVIPTPHPDYPGQWTLYICGLGRYVGKYPTSADAYRAAKRSGYNIGQEAPSCQQ
jgi:hypothetical protein